MSFATLASLIPNISDLQLHQEPLQSKQNSDRLNGNEKPGMSVPGYSENKLDSLRESGKNGSNYTPILPDMPNLYKHNGMSMSKDTFEEGFIKLPRSLLSSEIWKNFTFRHQKLFLYILEKVQYKTKIYNHKGKEILVLPGQYCITYRRLVDEFNQSIKFKKEKIDLPFLQRAVSMFNKFLWTDTRSDTGIMIITITYPDIYAHFKTLSDTDSDTKSIQNRYTNEERKKDKNVKETIDGAGAPDSLLLNKKNPNTPSVFQAESSQNETKLDSMKQEQFQSLWKIINETGMGDGKTKDGKPGIKEKDLIGWLKNHKYEYILECLKKTHKAKITKTYAGYVNLLLKKEVPRQEEASKDGRKMVEEFVKKNQITHIEFLKDYFRDLISNEETYYNLPKDTLKPILMRSLERFKQMEEEEKKQEEYAENY